MLRARVSKSKTKMNENVVKINSFFKPPKALNKLNTQFSGTQSGRNRLFLEGGGSETKNKALDNVDFTSSNQQLQTNLNNAKSKGPGLGSRMKYTSFLSAPRGKGEGAKGPGGQAEEQTAPQYYQEHRDALHKYLDRAYLTPLETELKQQLRKQLVQYLQAPPINIQATENAALGGNGPYYRGNDSLSKSLQSYQSSIDELGQFNESLENITE